MQFMRLDHALKHAIAAAAEAAESWRRHLHQHPELQFVERETADFVAARLDELGLSVDRGLGGTGVVAVIEGRLGAGPSIGLRAELDALPIEEACNVPHSSRAKGVMHACGHDGHMAMLLGAAKVLSENPDFPGRVVLIFQPAEEHGGGGEKMIEDGLFERFACDEVYAIHNMPGIPLGHVASRPGAIMAAACSWDLDVNGRGAHAGWPHTGIDGIRVAQEFVSGCQGIVARETDPVQPAVISPTQIHAGTNYNVIPEKVRMGGTIRTLDDATMTQLQARMRRLSKGLSVAHDCDVALTINAGYPVTVNHPEQVEAILQIAENCFGREHVQRDVAAKMGTEDFAYMLAARPGAYVFLGTGDSAPLHNPAYDFADAVLETGIRLWVALVLARTRALA